MSSQQARIFDLQFYRERRAAGRGEAVAAPDAAPVTSYGTMSVAPFAIPMAFFAVWPALVFAPHAIDVRATDADGGRGAG